MDGRQNNRYPRQPWRPSANLGPEKSMMDGVEENGDLIAKPEAWSDEIRLTDFKPITSYSWLDEKQPTILIPGSPPSWKDPDLPARLRKDYGIIACVDPDDLRVPGHTMLPMILAVKHVDPEHALSDYDIVTDRNGLKKLLRWINQTDQYRDFRIDIEIVGIDTLLFSRWDIRTYEQGGAGFGHEFKKLTVKEAGWKESLQLDHRRIVAYDFNGLNILMRYNVDACLEATADQEAVCKTDSRSDKGPDKNSNVDELSAVLDGLSIESPSTTTSAGTATTVSKPTITIKDGGAFVPQESLVEITSRSIRNVVNINWPDVYPQLLFSPMPNLFLGVHEYGTFTEIRKRNLSELTEAHEQCLPAIKQLRAVLQVLVDRVREEEYGQRFALICRNGELRLHKRRDNKQALPDDALSLFA